jgi:hypothetical protein
MAAVRKTEAKRPAISGCAGPKLALQPSGAGPFADSIKPGHCFQIPTDGSVPYVSAIQTTFGEPVDFAQLIKVYKAGTEGEARYSPATVESVNIVPVISDPDPKRICTSIVERQNLTIRMSMRRLTRLTNAFSKKLENLWAAYCLHFAYYNFCRIHSSLRVTPAMASNLKRTMFGRLRSCWASDVRKGRKLLQRKLQIPQLRTGGKNCGTGSFLNRSPGNRVIMALARTKPHRDVFY